MPATPRDAAATENQRGQAKPDQHSALASSSLLRLPQPSPLRCRCRCRSPAPFCSPLHRPNRRRFPPSSPSSVFGLQVSSPVPDPPARAAAASLLAPLQIRGRCSSAAVEIRHRAPVLTLLAARDQLHDAPRGVTRS